MNQDPRSCINCPLLFVWETRREKNYQLTPVEEAAYKQSRNRRVPLSFPGILVPFAAAFGTQIKITFIDFFTFEVDRN
jgi:hypothetical protein